MYDKVQSVELDANRTLWVRSKSPNPAAEQPPDETANEACDQRSGAALRIGVTTSDASGGRSTDTQYVRLDPEQLEPGVIDTGVSVPDPSAGLPPPTSIGGHLVVPIVRMPEQMLALDVDEADRPLTRAWRPCPSDLRATRTKSGLDLALDLPFVAVEEDCGPLGFDLVLEAYDSPEASTATSARLEPGPGVIGVLRALVPNDRLAPDQAYTLLVHTSRGTSRLGLDLVLEGGVPRVVRSTKVSVIVPAYNAGGSLGDCLGTAVAQSIPREEYEVIVVDDGSSDGTAGLLDWLTGLHPQLRVLHTARTDDLAGPGGPRNAGIDAARGEYVFFLDATDRLGTTALEGLFAYARTYDSDIVVGKTIGQGVHVPRGPYRRSKPHATLTNTPLAESLTPHKLFRKKFLDRHALRFETGHGFEDHRFVSEAYLLAERISVYADAVCYIRVERDGAVGSARSHPPAEYAELVRGSIALVEKYLGPGEEQSRFLRRWYRREVLRRMRGTALLELPASERAEWFAALRGLARDCFDVTWTKSREHFTAEDRVVAGLLHAGRLDVLTKFAAWELDTTLHAVAANARWTTGDTLEVTVRADPQGFGQSMVVPSDNRLLLDPPLTATGWTALVEALGRDVVDVTPLLRGTQMDVLVDGDLVATTKPAYDGNAFVASVVLPAAGLVAGRHPVTVRLRSSNWSLDGPLRASTSTLTRQHPRRLPSFAARAPEVGEPTGSVAAVGIDIAPDEDRPWVVRLEAGPRPPTLKMRIIALLKMLGG